MKNILEKIKTALKKAYQWLLERTKAFLTRAYINNASLWLYALGGGVFGLAAQKIGFLNSTLANTSYGFVGAGVAMLFVILFGFKVYAVSEMKKTGATIKELFGGYFNYAADTFGDVTLALAVGLLVLWV